MTLSTWLRDYVFFPLGGSRGSQARTYFNLWLTMVLVGVWHGASWNFVIYGNLHAAALLYSRFNRMQAQRGEMMYGLMAVAASLFLATCAVGLGTGLGLSLDHALLLGAAAFMIAVVNGIMPIATEGAGWSLVHLFLTFQFTVLSRVFFRADSLESAGQMTSKLLAWDFLGVRDGLFRLQGMHAWVRANVEALGDLAGPLLVFSQWGLLIVIGGGLGYHFLPSRWSEGIGQRITRWLPAPALGFALAFSMLLISRLLDGPRANIYFSF
jgi:D-alanyl-lipoteichoic acid acyltransferase DltB (MBOAT superfamily)